jgi:hypothetical protein
MKKITMLCTMLMAFALHGQQLNWTNAAPNGILMDASLDAWHSGRVMDAVDFKDGSVMVATETGGVWWANRNGDAACLTNDLDDPNMLAIERGPDGENHLYFASNKSLYVSLDPKLDGMKRIPLPPNAAFVRDIAVLNGARTLIVGCDNGVFWSNIPVDPVSGEYRWQQATGGNNGGNVLSVSARSRGGEWMAVEQPTSDRIRDGKMAVVNRNPIARDLFWIGADRSVRRAWSLQHGDWAGHTLSITATNVAHLNSEITAISRHGNQMDVFYAGPNGELRTSWWNALDDRWGNGQILGQGSVDPDGCIQAISRYPNSIDVFFLSASGRLMVVNWLEGRGWDTPASVSGAEQVADGSRFSVVARRPHLLNVFWISPTGAIKTNWADDNAIGRWTHLYTVPIPGAAASGAGVSAVGRDGDKMDLAWVSSDGALMTTYWNRAMPEEWANHAYPLTDVGVASTRSPIVLTSRNPLQLDLFWVGADGVANQNSWYAFSNRNFQQNTHPIGPIGSFLPRYVMASAAMDDEITVYAMGNDGSLAASRWHTNGGEVAVGYMIGSLSPVNVGRFEAGELQLSTPLLTETNTNFGTASVSLSKYGTSCYASIANATSVGATREGELNTVYKTEDLSTAWDPTGVVATGDRLGRTRLSDALGKGGNSRNNAIAASPTRNDVAFIGYNYLYRTTNGGATWENFVTPHTHEDVAKIFFSDHDRDGMTAFFCTDGGISSCNGSIQSIWSRYNMGLATLQAYCSDGFGRQTTGLMGANPVVDGVIAIGLQDNGNVWTQAGSKQWNSMARSIDGGNFIFLPDGNAVHNTRSAGPFPLSAIRWGNPPVDIGPTQVLNSRIPGVTGDISPLRVATVINPQGESLQAIAWDQTNFYTLRSLHGLIAYAFVNERTVSLDPDEAISAGASIDGNGIVLGTSNGRIVTFRRGEAPVAFASLPFPSGTTNPQDFGINKIVLYSSSVGYAVANRWRNLNGSNDDEGYLFKLENGTWRHIPLQFNATSPIPPQRIYGIDVAWPTQSIVLATDDKIYVSRDGGGIWSAEKNGLPTLAHLADVHFVNWPKLGRKFLVSSYGRGVWITDAP